MNRLLGDLQNARQQANRGTTTVKAREALQGRPRAQRQPAQSFNQQVRYIVREPLGLDANRIQPPADARSAPLK